MFGIGDRVDVLLRLEVGVLLVAPTRELLEGLNVTLIHEQGLREHARTRRQ